MPYSESEDSASLWTSDVKAPSFDRLKADLQADVCVVGAGIAGLTTAYLLSRAGQRVIVLEERNVCGGESARTTAHLSNVIDDRFFEMERVHGEAKTRLMAESHTAAIDQIETIIRENTIACDFRRLDGYLFAPPDGSGGVLQQELEAAHRAGLEDASWISRAPLEFNTGRCLRFPGQGQFHPLKYLFSLARLVSEQGALIFTRTRVCDVEGGSPCHVRSEAGPTVKAREVVVATNTPFNNRLSILHTKQSAYRTYVIGARVPRNSVHTALFWDTQDPYHYIRIQPAGPGTSPRRRRAAPKRDSKGDLFDILIVGGGDHKTGQARDFERPYQDLEEWTRARFTRIRDIPYRWSGQVMETMDGIAFIGLSPDDRNVYIATGDSGMGMTHGSIGGMLLSDIILERENPWSEIYDPSRFSAGAVAEYTRESINVVIQYTDWINKGDVESTDDIERGCGAVYVEGMDKWASYRDPGGTLHQCSAVCPHLGCIVHWNRLEHTWDCPCHGSRFDPYGKVLNGPASKDLETTEEWKDSLVRNTGQVLWNAGNLMFNFAVAAMTVALSPLRWTDAFSRSRRPDTGTDPASRL